MKQREEEIQKECVRVFRYLYPSYQWRLFAIPNGGQRNVAVASKLKATGTLSGVWDLFLSVPKNSDGGMFIEIKAGKNKLTENQEHFKKANLMGYDFVVCYSVEEFIKAVQRYLS